MVKPLLGDKEFGIDNRVLAKYAEEIKQVHEMGVELAIVIGGGNIFRGVQAVEGGMKDQSECRLYGHARYGD